MIWQIDCLMKDYGFKQAYITVFFYKRDDNNITLLLVYIDDMIINMIVIGSITSEIEKLCSYLVKEFEMKDLKNLKYFLGIQVSHFK